MTEKEKMINGESYNPMVYELEQDRFYAKSLCLKYNALEVDDKERKNELLTKLVAKKGKSLIIEPNFFCDYGYNLEFGENCYVNHNSVFLDCAKITFGKNVFVGPNCGFYTAIHPINVEERLTWVESAEPITVKDNVWIGGNCVLLPGVTIGENTVIGAGSVVTKDISANVVAVGNPCKPIKQLAE